MPARTPAKGLAARVAREDRSIRGYLSAPAQQGGDGEEHYSHLFAQDRASVLAAMNQAVSRLHAYESTEPGPGGDENAAA